MLDLSVEEQANFVFKNCGTDIQKALETLPLGVIITNTQGRVIFYNKAHAQIDELTQDMMLGNIENDVLFGLDINTLCQTTKKPIKGFISPYRTIRGKEIDATYWVYPLFNQGQIVGAIGFTHDQGLDTSNLKETKKYQVEWPSSRLLPHRRNFIAGQSPGLQKLLLQARQAANGPLPVLLSGPTGSGKEVFANYIHKFSDRSKNKYLAINCAAIPATLMEGLLFGTTKGSFTGATDQQGLFEEADGGVLYLDELDSMSLELQPKLLRFLQNMTIRRLGSDTEKTVDVKIISSIGMSPQRAMAEGRLREDIFYRLAVLSITLPGLADRLEDLPDLCNHFINKYNLLLKREIVQIDEKLSNLFFSYHWPGNIRELEHILAGALNTCRPEDVVISFEHLTPHYQEIFSSLGAKKKSITRQMALHLGNYPHDINYSSEIITNKSDIDSFEQTMEVILPLPSVPPNKNLNENNRAWDEVKSMVCNKEIELICQALTATVGQVALAAQRLGISRQLLNYRMKKYGISRLKFKPGHQAPKA